MPKCVTGGSKPVLPCRSVCLEFVNKCQGLLALASHAGMFRALCDLLPQQDYSPTTCFIPEGFTPSTTDALGKYGGTSMLKRRRLLVVNFEKKTLRCTNVFFCGRGSDLFTPKKYQLLNNTLTNTDFFPVNTRKGIVPPSPPPPHRKSSCLGAF